MADSKLLAFSRRVVQVMPFLLREFLRREDNPLTRGAISFPQMVTLHTISQTPSVKMKDLARVLSIKMSSATVLADRLIRQGMLVRERDERDRRVVWIRITPRGRRVIRQILRQKEESIRHIFSAITERERAQYLGVLLKVYARLTSRT